MSRHQLIGRIVSLLEGLSADQLAEVEVEVARARMRFGYGPPDMAPPGPGSSGLLKHLMYRDRSEDDERSRA